MLSSSIKQSHLKMKSEESVRFEDILKLVGENGKWQVVIFLFTWIEGMLIGCHHLSSVFLGASVDHWCNTSHIDPIQNKMWTPMQKRQFAIPFDNATSKFVKCEQYDFNTLGFIPDDFDRAMSTRPTDLRTISCLKDNVDETLSWEYDTTEGIQSVVSDWALVCERLPLLSTVQASYMFGVFVGCVIFGWASDKFGRRRTMLVASSIQVLSSVSVSFSSDYVAFIFFRFLTAFSVSGVFECGFVLVTEIVGPKYRTYYGILTQFPFGLGATLLPIVAYYVREWHSLQLAISLPCFLLASYYWFIPESPRWLMSKRRFQEAVEVVKEGARVNGNTLPDDEQLISMMETIESQEEEEEAHEARTVGEKMYEFFKELIIMVETKEMRRRSINIVFSWLVVALVYYGLSLNVKNLGGNRYISTGAVNFVEVPAVVVIIPLLSRLGRVKCYSGTFVLGSVCCAIVVAVTILLEPAEAVWLATMVGIVGKFLISMTFAIAYLYTAELFPTNVRNAAVGIASTFARVGAMAAPFIVDLLGAFHSSIPMVIFGLFSLTAGLLTAALPETLNRQMPETVAEIEKARSNNNNQSSESGVEMRSTGGARANSTS